MNSKILYLTHKIDDQIIEEFRNLGNSGIDLELLYNGSNDGNIPTPNFCFTDSDIWKLDYPVISDELIDHTHFPVLNYFNQNDENYDSFWIIEYDVRYTGNWSAFFSQFDNSNADFITSHIRFYKDEPEWLGWHIDHPHTTIELENRLRSFNPIYRISKRALEFIDRKLKSGYAGHYEVLFPTLMYHERLKMIDFGGNSDFVKGKKNQNYISRSNRRGEIFGGTFRYRPTMKKAGSRKNMLYHPVKSDSKNGCLKLLTVLDEYIKLLIFRD